MEAADSSVLLLIAHPDDESMFFVPLLHCLSTKVTTFPDCVHVVCMTNGGTHREAELKAALHSIYKIQNIAIFSNEDYPDSPATPWDLQKASKAVLDYVQQHKIGKIYTFDEHGVSGHLNHVSCCRIANLLKIQLQRDQIAE
uniref:N-acetylglucosaminylphosphatidylinositol deacetylase n=1 Tax=Dermatophagoides pteronyssinus TaxID=6956 RepID=A0A6P6YKL5_DERPT|nr:probable N-acetylglucosaminyl-phosphatidylinositol de-N-acetylase [Dermatophagoides pteronyssinus]